MGDQAGNGFQPRLIRPGTQQPETRNQKPETDIMTMAIAKGLDGAIINPLDGRMMANIVAAEALAGRDSFCMNDLKAFRTGVLPEE